MNTNGIPRNPLERTLWVQMHLRLRQQSFSTIARDNGWKRQTVALAMKLPSYPQEVAIASALGLTVEALFPERYDEHGVRIHPLRGNSNNAIRNRRIAS
jgi:lambda repressor-like predicted transcriptional regulator